MLKGFRDFLMRGNVVDLAVAVIIGGAFGAVVTALVKDLITPLIAALFGKPDFSAIVFEVNGSKFLIGDFLNALVAFLMVATAIYFFVVTPVNALMARVRRGEVPPNPTTKKCPECLSVRGSSSVAKKSPASCPPACIAIPTATSTGASTVWLTCWGGWAWSRASAWARCAGTAIATWNSISPCLATAPFSTP
jgi:large conductance mechanosensitive channel